MQQNTPDLFTKPHFMDYPLDDIVGEWLAELEGRPVSPATVVNYRKAMESFVKSLRLHERPMTLESLTEDNVNVWKVDLRKGRLPNHAIHNGWTRPSAPSSETTIRSYLTVIKVFANRWVKRRYSKGNLLEEVTLGKEVVEIKEALSPADREKLMAACDGSGFEAVRDRAFVQLLLATACRFKEIYGLTADRVDTTNKRLWVVLKGGRQVPVDIDGRALRDFSLYLRRRRDLCGPDTSAVWLSDSGKPLTYWGAYGIFNRLSDKTGVKCNPHRFRHTFAQMMAAGDAPVADIQDALHHTSDRMSRRYIGNARQEVAAGLAKKWSLAG